MSKISIVIPVYNVETYLEECVQSVRNQTFSDIEIILIDDGSTDKSGQICDHFAEIDNRVKVLHKKNEGVANARRDGVEKATSAYICFLDSDDFLENVYCEKMYDCIKTYNADIVECAFYKFTNGQDNEHQIFQNDTHFEDKEFRRVYVGDMIINGTEAVVVWNKLYKREYIARYVVEYGKDLLEDYIFNLQYFAMVKKYIYIAQPLLHYRQVAGSLSRKCNPNTYQILKKMDLLKQKKMYEMGLTNERYQKETCEWYLRYTLNYLQTCIVAGKKKEDVIHIILDSVLQEKCRVIANTNRNAKRIASEQADAVYHQLCCRVFRWKMKCRLIRIKRMLRKA